MKINCKPGDLAVIIASDPYANPDSGGVLCDVLHHPPAEDFDLPDGFPVHANQDLNRRWVIRLHRPITVRWNFGATRSSMYAVCPDNMLRPIRDNDGEDETLTWAPKHEGVTA